MSGDAVTSTSEDALLARERERRGMSDDDDVAPAGASSIALRMSAHVVGQVASGTGASPYVSGAATRAELCEHAAEEGLAPLRVRHVLGGDVSPLGRPADDVLVDVVEAELAGDEAADLLAPAAHRS